MSDLTLWDDAPAPLHERRMWDRPRWDHTLPCHICGQPLTRWVRLNSGGYADGWYSWELMEPTWAHLRHHWAELRMVGVLHGPIRNGHKS
jgi:hypothetical protein